MSTRLLTHIQRKFSLFMSPVKRYKHSAIMYDDLNWHRSRHRHKKPHTNHHNGHHHNGHHNGHHKAPDKAKLGKAAVQHATIHQGTHDFDIVSFNLLAPVYKRLTTKNFTGRRDREASKNDLWQDRLAQTMDFFKQEIYKDTAIIALQEYWLDDRYRELFESEFRKHGYDYRIMQRAGTKVDAVALVIKTDVFDILGVENVDLCAMGDRVALLAWLRHRTSGLDVLVANTHLSFPHHVFDRLNQVAQMKHLTSVIEWFARTHGVTEAPVLIMGDFNVEGHSPVCDHLRSEGYYSCFEVCPPANSIVSPYPPSQIEEAVLKVEHERATSEVFHGAEVGSKVLEYLPTTADITVEVKVRSGALSGASGGVDGVSGGVVRASDCVACDDVGDNCVPVDVDDCADGDGNSAECSEAHAHTNTNTSAGTATNNTSAGTATTTIDTTTTTDSTAATATGTHTTHTTHHEHMVLPTSLRRVTYVSHYNHRSEQVGVDHIFLKPNQTVTKEGINETHGEEKWDKLPQRPVGVTTQEAVPAYLSVGKSVDSVGGVGVSKDSSISVSGSKGVQSKVDDVSTVNTDASPNSDSSANSTSDSSESSSDNTRVYVAECQVLPTALHCTTWSPEFVISDHRPVRTKIVFTK